MKRGSLYYNMPGWKVKSQLDPQPHLKTLDEGTIRKEVQTDAAPTKAEILRHPTRRPAALRRHTRVCVQSQRKEQQRPMCRSSWQSTQQNVVCVSEVIKSGPKCALSRNYRTY